MSKKIITNIIKMALASGLIFWLVSSDKLDFTLLSELIQNPGRTFLAIILMLITLLFITLRLKIFLLQRAAQNLSTIKLYLTNWIGLFFNSVLPGSVTGDLVKIFYIQKQDHQLSKKFLLISVFADRVVGLMGLIFLGGLVSIVNYSSLTNLSNDVKSLIHINILLTAIMLVSISLIYIAPNALYKPIKMGKKIRTLNKVFLKVESIWDNLLMFKNKLIWQIVLSLCVQGVAIYIFWFITHPYADGDFDLITAFSVMPVGFISIAIPIAPAGLGVGHVVFEKLLSLFSISNGASLFNLYFFVVILCNLTGVIPYLFYSGGDKVKLAQITD